MDNEKQSNTLLLEHLRNSMSHMHVITDNLLIISRLAFRFCFDFVQL